MCKHLDISELFIIIQNKHDSAIEILTKHVCNKEILTVLV